MDLVTLTIDGRQLSVPKGTSVLKAAIDAGTCTLIAALGSLISPLTGRIAGILAAASATLIVFSSQILTDTLFLFFFTGMLLAGAGFLLRPASWLAGIAGVAGGLALDTRAAILLLLIVAVPLIFTVAPPPDMELLSIGVTGVSQFVEKKAGPGGQ